jgi:2,3-bisphosphoglycerate-independent phosphoglycerate mutase
MPFDYLKPLLLPSDKKIVLLVLDGLGGLPMEAGGPTALEAAEAPNLDRLASEASLGQTIPIRRGLTPGSGPAHLALFGYDPLVYDVGRGALSAAGIGVDVNPGDVAARGNLCSLDADGNIIDRRAGRISHEKAAPIVEILNGVQVPGVKTEVHQVKEYRVVVVMRGEGLDPRLTDTDPQKTGVPPLPTKATDPAAERTAELFNQWLEKARQALVDQPQANGVNLRGFATDPALPSYQDAYHLKAACIAGYPMYRGVSKLVGMDVIEVKGSHPEDEFEAAKRIWNEYDFLFIHIKKTDSMGEDGNFDGKIKIIEELDAALPQLMALNPDVLMVTGDHATPARMKSHSWHPVPFLLWAPETALPDTQTKFGERACALGGLGTFPAIEAMSLALAHAQRLNKYGA